MKYARIYATIAAVSLVGGWSGLATIAEDPSTTPDSTSISSEQPESAEIAVDPVLQLAEQAIAISSRRYLTVGVHTPWQIMHGALGLRQNFLLKQGDQKIPVLEWVSNEASYRNTPLFQVTEYGGRAQPYTEPYIFEGHPNQFLACTFTMSNVPLDYQIKVSGGRTITVADLVRNAQMDANSSVELTWTLWSLCHYLPPDAQWTNKNGEEWSIERLVSEETAAEVNGAACGGTHRIFALSYARNQYLKTGQPLRGVWLEAEQKIRRHIEIARSLQNSDGTFSSNFFERGGYTHDYTDRLAASGHTLECLMMALPDERLHEDWVRNGAAAVARDLIEHKHEAASCGPLYHAVDSLVMYRDRMRPVQVHVATSNPVLEKQAAESAGQTEKVPATEPLLELFGEPTQK